MSTNRMIKDSFWTDSYIENLDPIEKLLYIYLLTNPLCNIAGIYQIQTKRIAFEIGIDKEMVEKLLIRLSDDGKIIRYTDWMLIINHAKHQSFKNPNVTAGIKRIIEDLPNEVKALKGFERLAHFTLLNLTLPNSTLLNSTQPNAPAESVALDKKDKIVEFDKFWSSYPIKKGKGTAEKAWLKFKPNLEVVLGAIEKQKQSDQWTKDKGKFIPYPATWLNGKRWEDETEVTTSSKFAKYDS
jgi:hypothetical protein